MLFSKYIDQINVYKNTKLKKIAHLFSTLVLSFFLLPSIITTNFDNMFPKNGTQNFSYKYFIGTNYAAREFSSWYSLFFITSKSNELKRCWNIKKSSSPFNKLTSEEMRSSTNSSKVSKRGSTIYYLIVNIMFVTIINVNKNEIINPKKKYKYQGRSFCIPNFNWILTTKPRRIKKMPKYEFKERSKIFSISINNTNSKILIIKSICKKF